MNRACVAGRSNRVSQALLYLLAEFITIPNAWFEGFDDWRDENCDSGILTTATTLLALHYGHVSNTTSLHDTLMTIMDSKSDHTSRYTHAVVYYGIQLLKTRLKPDAVEKLMSAYNTCWPNSSDALPVEMYVQYLLTVKSLQNSKLEKDSPFHCVNMSREKLKEIETWFKRNHKTPKTIADLFKLDSQARMSYMWIAMVTSKVGRVSLFDNTDVPVLYVKVMDNDTFFKCYWHWKMTERTSQYDALFENLDKIIFASRETKLIHHPLSHLFNMAENKYRGKTGTNLPTIDDVDDDVVDLKNDLELGNADPTETLSLLWKFHEGELKLSEDALMQCAKVFEITLSRPATTFEERAVDYYTLELLRRRLPNSNEWMPRLIIDYNAKYRNQKTDWIELYVQFLFAIVGSHESSSGDGSDFYEILARSSFFVEDISEEWKDWFKTEWSTWAQAAWEALKNHQVITLDFTKLKPSENEDNLSVPIWRHGLYSVFITFMRDILLVEVPGLQKYLSELPPDTPPMDKCGFFRAYWRFNAGFRSPHFILFDTISKRIARHIQPTDYTITDILSLMTAPESMCVDLTIYPTAGQGMLKNLTDVILRRYEERPNEKGVSADVLAYILIELIKTQANYDPDVYSLHVACVEMLMPLIRQHRAMILYATLRNAANRYAETVDFEELLNIELHVAMLLRHAAEQRAESLDPISCNFYLPQKCYISADVKVKIDEMLASGDMRIPANFSIKDMPVADQISVCGALIQSINSQEEAQKGITVSKIYGIFRSSPSIRLQNLVNLYYERGLEKIPEESYPSLRKLLNCQKEKMTEKETEAEEPMSFVSPVVVDDLIKL